MRHIIWHLRQTRPRPDQQQHQNRHHNISCGCKHEHHCPDLDYNLDPGNEISMQVECPTNFFGISDFSKNGTCFLVFITCKAFCLRASGFTCFWEWSHCFFGLSWNNATEWSRQSFTWFVAASTHLKGYESSLDNSNNYMTPSSGVPLIDVITEFHQLILNGAGADQILPGNKVTSW